MDPRFIKEFRDVKNSMEIIIKKMAKPLKEMREE
jgi:hypothetical protein